MNTLPTNIINTITDYIPNTLKRSLNKQYYLNNTKEYCELAAHIYNDDMLYVINNYNHFVVYYYNKNFQLEAHLQLPNQMWLYKIKQKDDYYILSIKNKNKELEFNSLIDVDLLSQYQILKNRGCEDFKKDFAKSNVIHFLQNTFNNYFNPDNIQDLIYLYVYLHSNNILIYHNQINVVKKTFKIGKIPKDVFLKDIYDLYNLLYVYFDVLENS